MHHKFTISAVVMSLKMYGQYLYLHNSFLSLISRTLGLYSALLKGFPNGIYFIIIALIGKIRNKVQMNTIAYLVLYYSLIILAVVTIQ